MGLKGAVAPLKTTFPLSFEGEGDKGGEVDPETTRFGVDIQSQGWGLSARYDII